MHIKSKDKVVVIAGKDRGKQGRVKKVYKSSLNVLVENVNFMKKAVKSEKDNNGFELKEYPIHVSNVMLVCEKCNKPTRISKSILTDNKKVRVCKKCGENII